MPPQLERWVGVWLPFLDAYEAGLWLFWVTEREVIAVPRPAVHIVDDRLHRADGPAVCWPNGARYWFWRGMQVPQRFIEQPETITAEEITNERNAEFRRVMIERVGPERYIREAGAERLHSDEWGTLWRARFRDDEDLVVVQVTNSSPEPDGSFKDYWLRVHPQIRPMLPDGRMGLPQKMTAKNAIASTMGLRGEDYVPARQT